MGGSNSKAELHQALSQELNITSDDANLVILEANDTKTALDVWTDAFQKDPMMCWVGGLEHNNPPASTKAARVDIARYMLSWINDDLLNGRRGFTIGIRNSQQELVGAMSMAPSTHAFMGIWDTIRMVVKNGRPPMDIGSEKEQYCDNAMERLNALAVIDKARDRQMNVEGKHAKWLYLQTIGVHTDYQGKGKYGSKMLRFIQQAATSMNAAIYLETESKENVSMYQHFGFETLEELSVSVPGDDRQDATLVMYLMRWSPPSNGKNLKTLR